MLVGILFLILGGLDINDPEHQNTANILNNTATVRKIISITYIDGNDYDLFFMLFDLSNFQVVVFIITLLNVVISGFNIQHTETAVFEKIESLKIK